MKVTPSIEKVSIKSQGVLKCLGRWLSDGQVKKYVLHQIIVHDGTLLKSISAVGFSEKNQVFCEDVSFHREQFCVTNFLLVLRICSINVMIFIQKNIDKLVQDQFLQPVNDHPYDNFGYVAKIMPFFQTKKN